MTQKLLSILQEALIQVILQGTSGQLHEDPVFGRIQTKGVLLCSVFNKYSLNPGQCITLGAIFSKKEKVIYLEEKELNNETLDVVFRNLEMPSISLKWQSLL